MTCLAACTLSDVYGHVLNAQVISALSVSAPIARDVIYLASRAIPLLAIAFIVPLILSPKTAKRISAASGILARVGCMLMLASLAEPQNATTLITLAFTLLCIDGTWYNTLPVLMLCRLANFGSIALCACVPMPFPALSPLP